MAQVSLDGQVAVISGGLGDIGQAIALSLAHCGADVAVADVLDVPAAAGLRATIAGMGRRFDYQQVDVADADAVQRWVRSVEASLGTPTLIIPNAAIVNVASVLEVTPAQWRQEMGVNLDGAFHMAQSAARLLVAARRPGRIVFIGSWAGHAPAPTIPTYCAAKAAMRMLAQTLALTLAEHDILVNEVAPGYVNAGLTKRIWDSQPALREAGIQRVPVHRLISPQEVADQVVHLCDPANRHMTGSVVLMDGGLSLRRI